VQRRFSKQLVCPACGVVVADATYTRWPPSLVLLSPEGVRIPPENGALQLRRAQAERAEHPSPEAGERVDFLRRHLGELIHDLRCRNGHRTLRTVPQLVRAIRHSQGRWVDLRPR
jgi:hypothetical protein